MQKGLRCFAEKSDSGWQAICVDLDIAVQGDSFEEVKELLDSDIAMYLESVAELPEDDRHRLLNRRAPLLTRMGHAMSHFRYFVLRSGHIQDRHDFVTACPV
jgi:hypothetical protein